MFAFLCPIRHPVSSDDYEQVIKYLLMTIESVCSQNTDRDFLFVVVCNKAPETKGIDKRVIFIEVDFPPPDSNKGAHVPMNIFSYDKGSKLARGIVELKEYEPDYVYIIDGDDWVNVNTVEYVYKNPSDLLYANSGYVINFAAMNQLKKYGVCRYCGSTYIYKYDVLLDITSLRHFEIREPTQKQLIEAIGEYILMNILGNHRYQLNLFGKKGYSIKQIRIPVTAWVLNTGQNHSQQSIDNVGLPISKRFLQEFGIKSVLPSKKSKDISTALPALIATFRSWLGWLLTDKKSEKV